MERLNLRYEVRFPRGGARTLLFSDKYDALEIARICKGSGPIVVDTVTNATIKSYCGIPHTQMTIDTMLGGTLLDVMS